MRIGPLPTALTLAASLVALGFSPAATPLAFMQKGKPQPPPPPPSTYSATLGPSIYDDPSSTGTAADYPDNSRDGLRTAGYLSLPAINLTGSISGPNKNGNFTGTIGGPIGSFIITGVAELPDWFAGGDPCQEGQIDQLTALGLVGSAVSGSLTWKFGELTGSLKTKPRIEWQLDGVTDSQGATWKIAGHSGSSRSQFFPYYEPGSTADHLTVTVEGSVVDFVGPTFSVLKCRTDFTMTLTRVS